MASLRGVGLTVKYKTRIRHGMAESDPLLPCAHAVEAARQSGSAMLVFVGQEKNFPHGRRTPMRYQLYYWPEIQGRGEFIRLALEETGADYVDVARLPKQGMAAMMRLLESPAVEHPPFAPPFLKAGNTLIAQTANILFFLGPRLGLISNNEATRLWAHQLQLTI